MTNDIPYPEGSENFWKMAADDSAFWDTYISTRPNYSEAFYNLIYARRTKHSNSRAVAHDIGYGGGQVVAELASRFTHAIASDNNDIHLPFARRRLASLPASSISFTYTKGEDLTAHYPPQSANMITAAKAMVPMDENVGSKTIALVLKSDGTLAFWFYGRPTFLEPEYYHACQPILSEIVTHNWSKRAAEGMASWLDYLAFNPTDWDDLQRFKKNTYATLPFSGREACRFDNKAVSNRTNEERVTIHEDPEFWKVSWNAIELKKYMSILFPGFKDAAGDGPGETEIGRLFNELTLQMGSERAICRLEEVLLGWDRFCTYRVIAWSGDYQTMVQRSKSWLFPSLSPPHRHSSPIKELPTLGFNQLPLHTTQLPSQARDAVAAIIAKYHLEDEFAIAALHRHRLLPEEHIMVSDYDPDNHKQFYTRPTSLAGLNESELTPIKFALADDDIWIPVDCQRAVSTSLQEPPLQFWCDLQECIGSWGVQKTLGIQRNNGKYVEYQEKEGELSVEVDYEPDEYFEPTAWAVQSIMGGSFIYTEIAHCPKRDPNDPKTHVGSVP
ncbi:hypothetical protein EV356DRAFT_567938 [Viridothelium virens]|uniref:Methyltransferase domain-containing protein n=1 Tax=Viridothelium virens TaxID=1048519 RepID=A0A6A6H7H4_VIRVR|nr:hypothetical protein EV356DRAFT_567938 [Viridothelium virens]